MHKSFSILHSTIGLARKQPFDHRVRCLSCHANGCMILSGWLIFPLESPHRHPGKAVLVRLPAVGLEPL